MNFRIFVYSTILLFSLSNRSLSAFDLDPGGVRVEEGAERYEQGDFKDSLKKYQEAETYFPEDARLEFNRGAAEFKAGNVAKAIRHFEKSASSSDPELQWRSRYNLGNSYKKVGDRKRAAEEYIKALKLNPNLKEARKNLEYLRHNPPSSDPKSDRQKQEQGNGSSPNGSLPQERGDRTSAGSDTDPRSGSERGGKLSEEEAKRILDSLDLNKVRRKSKRSKDREVFW
nr:tetratricopeptide repeat protein [Leptospira gomenensis]